MLKRSLISLALAAATLPAPAMILWLENQYDFGLFKEAAGPKTGSVRFVNADRDTISVLEVKPSCGCTSASFTEGPIAPGDTAVISFTYDPYMRPGRFQKSVKVLLSDGKRYSIPISGNVLGTPESLSTFYPVEDGPLRLSDEIVNAGEVTMGRTDTRFVNGYAQTMDSISPVANPEAPGVIVQKSAPKIGPGDIVTFSLTFDSRKAGQYGPVEVPVKVVADSLDPMSESATIFVRAFVMPDSDALLLMQKGKNPICDLSPDPVEAVRSDDGRFSAQFEIANSGKAPLRVWRVFSESDAVTIGSVPKEIKKGKRHRVDVTVDTGLLPAGPFRIPVSVITDDPRTPLLQTEIVGIK